VLTDFLLALTIAATSSVPLAPAERQWLPFFEAQAGEKDVVSRYGAPDERNVMLAGGTGLFFRKTPEFPGGMDFWLDDDGRVTDATFYLAPLGRVFTRASKLVASKAMSRATLTDVMARYGPPTLDKEGKGRRIGVRRLIYEEPAGDATRSVTFFSIPFSPGLHAITVGWERP
jgi:hypothetical protein